jgi:hypothetical protein
MCACAGEVTAIDDEILLADRRSTWSEPIPAVTASFSAGAFAILSAVRYAGQNG